MAAPAGTREAVALRPGDLLAARYRLLRPQPAAPPGPSPRLWLARDEVLARPVAAKVLLAEGPDAAALTSSFLDAAAAAGGLDVPVIPRIYDAAVEQRTAGPDGGPVDVAYVIREWVEGTSLAELLERDGPYDAGTAVTLVGPLLEALSTTHERGLAHGRVHPGNVLVSADGRVRLTDLAVAAALPGGRVAAGRATDPGPREADVRDAAAVLYAMLTARWPDVATPQPSAGLRGAPALREGPSGRGRLTSPRQVRAGVPSALDAVVTRALDPVARRSEPALTSAAALADALGPAVRSSGPRLRSVRRPRSLPALVRRRLPLLAVLALLTGVGVAGFLAGRDLGTVRAPAGERAAPSTPSTAGQAAVPLDLTGAAVRDFDPAGDGSERPGSVANAHDGDPSTAWETERYDSGELGGLKDGVGLLVDLGAPTAVGSVELVLTSPGVRAELRGAAQPADGADGYRVLARAGADGDRLVLTPPAGTSERYYLVWLTGLAPQDGRFSAGVRELVFTR